MWTDHVRKLLHYCPNFRDVFPVDKLPRIKPNMSLIINTDVSSRRGSHWVSVYIDEDTLYFFDSYGRSINNFDNPFRRYMNKFSENYKIKTDSRLLQSFFSDSCGYWCIFYIFCKTCNLERFYKYFSVNLAFNEKILGNFFEYFDLM